MTTLNKEALIRKVETALINLNSENNYYEMAQAALRALAEALPDQEDEVFPFVFDMYYRQLKEFASE